MTDQLYTVTQLADNLGITARAVRFYEDKGLLNPRRAGNTRVYTHRDKARLILILRGKRLGFSLSEIKEYLDLYDLDPTQQEQIHVLLEKIERRVEQLEDQRVALDLTLRELREIEQQAHHALTLLQRSRAS